MTVYVPWEYDLPLTELIMEMLDDALDPPRPNASTIMAIGPGRCRVGLTNVSGAKWTWVIEPISRDAKASAGSCKGRRTALREMAIEVARRGILLGPHLHEVMR